MMHVAIVDYGSGNLRSAAKAFERAALEGDVDAVIDVTGDPARVARADRIVLPGVGAFADCLSGLLAVEGLRETLEQRVRRDAVPFFGICVGMQLMASVGVEHGRHAGLDWIEGHVERLAPSDGGLKIPHMGWNDLVGCEPLHPVLAHLANRMTPDGVPDGDHAYFVHSYHFVPANPGHVLARCDYGGPVTAAVGRDNMVGTQFHPEKSQSFGLTLIANFMKWSA